MGLKGKSAAVAAVAAGALAAAGFALWAIRITPSEIAAIKKDSARAIRRAAPDTVVPQLERMAGDWTVRSRFFARFPWVKVTRETRVPVDHIAYLAEDAFLRFSGRGYPSQEDRARIKALLAFAASFSPRCSPGMRIPLAERMLDAHFIIDDFDGAIAMLEAGFPGRSVNWARAAAAKIRAHRAEMRHDDAAALESFVAFGEAIGAEPDPGVPECDPATGISYSRSWVLAKNHRRIAEYAAKLGKAELAEKSRQEAARLYAKALEDLADDETSLAALKEEMKTAGM